jgi:hypothetical protein
MKKVIALLAVCGFAIALVSCGKKAEEASAPVDSTTVVETPVVDSVAVTDSVAVVDSAAVAQ